MVQIINTVDHAHEVDTHDAEAVNKAENRSLYASRVSDSSRRPCHGTFRRLKWILRRRPARHLLHHALAALGPRPGDAPDQAVLIDLANRRFYFFFIEIWPQEFYYVAGLLIMAGVGLFLVTSLFGRAWCGYACPQTVWTDLFIWVEALDRGRPQRPHQARRRALERFARSRKRGTKHGRLAADRHRHRRRLGLLFRRCADPARASLSPARRAPVAYFTIAILTATTFTFARLHARAGLHLHVPLAAHPGRDAGRGIAHRHLQRLARRAPHGRPQEGRGARPARSATASTATPAWPSAPWASTSATATSSNASTARSASTPATR